MFEEVGKTKAYKWYSTNQTFTPVTTAGGILRGCTVNKKGTVASTITLQEGVMSAVATADAGGDAALIDSGMAWVADAHAGSFVGVIAGTGVGESHEIDSNTETELILTATWTANPDATTRYIIGTADKATATAGSTNATVEDTGIGWTVDEHIGKRVSILDGTNVGETKVIASNTTDTLTVTGTFTAAIDVTSVYMIHSAASSLATAKSDRLIVDKSSTWTANQYAGSTVYLSSGTGSPQSAIVASNTKTAMVITTDWSTNPDATSVYQVSAAALATIAAIDSLNLSGTFNYDCEYSGGLLVTSTGTVPTEYTIMYKV